MSVKMIKRTHILSLAILLSAPVFAQDKMDAYTVTALSRMHTAAKAKGKDSQPAIRCFISVSSADAYRRLSDMGVGIGYASGGNATAEIPLSAIDAVLAMPEVTALQMSRPLSLDTKNTRAACFVDDVHRGKGLDRRYTGKGVIYGTVDQGIDFQHAAFKNDDGDPRILMVYLPDSDTKKTGAKENYKISISDYSTTLSGYVYDRIGLPGLTTGTPQASHGTHTASIAAGGMYGSETYYGMAPETDLIFVDSPALMQSDLINGIAFVFSEAQKLGKPAVVNMSIGNNAGSHSDNNIFPALMSSLTGPGRILCLSAGNSGHLPLWLHKAAGETVRTILARGNGNTQQLYGEVDLWGKDDKPVTMRLYARATAGNRLTLLYDSDKDGTKTISSSRYFKSGGVNVALAHTLNNYNIDFQFTVEMADGYQMVMEIAGDHEADAWSEQGLSVFAGEQDTDYREGSSAMSFNALGCFDNSITVGSYNVSRSFIWAGDGERYGYSEDYLPTGDITFFSSYGIDRDGRSHPTILAPGAMISAAYNYYDKASTLTDSFEDKIVEYEDIDGRLQPYGADMGTSMASPVVAGIIALWLQQNPTLSPQDVKNIFALTAINDEFTAADAKRSGYGKINALGGFSVPTEVIAQATGTAPVIMPSQHGFSVLVPNTTADTPVTVYNASGQRIMTASVPGGVTQSFAVGQRGMFVVRVGDVVAKLAVKQ